MDKKMITKRFFPIIIALMLAVALVIPAAVVSAAPALATRTLPAASVDAGADFTVGIVASGCGFMGQVVETLPAGFSYVGTDSPDVNVTQDGNAISFTFMGDAVTFDYTVTASTTAGPYSFSGIVKDDDLNEYTTGGDINITIDPLAEATATRTLPASADAGADFTVGIEASGCGSFGQVVETLPAGFSYVGTDSIDVAVTQDGNTVRFTFIGDAVTFDYTVTASTTAGSYSFSGIVKDDDLNEFTTGGDINITIDPLAEEATATRTLPASADAGADFTVGIEASGCGSFGQVVETLPAGFSYVGTDSIDVAVTQDGNTVRFTFIGDAVTFDYTVTASTTAGPYSFSGIVKDDDRIEYTTGGNTDITIDPLADGATATRTLPASAAAGADFTVGIEASGCGSFGQVVETLPSGFSYVGTDSIDVAVTQDGNTVRFTFIGDEVAFDYTVTASTTAGSYSFSGIVKDDDLNEYTTGGDTDIEITVSPLMLVLLQPGWNTFSTPIALDPDSGTWDDLLALSGLDDDVEIVYDYDVSTQYWGLVTTGHAVLPLDGFYVKLSDESLGGTVPIISNPEATPLPSKDLATGLNLIGPAPASLVDEDVIFNLATIYEAEGGLLGYSMVISPPIHTPNDWVYMRDDPDPPLMEIGNAYWVTMENPDTLWGSSSTPIP